MRNVFKEILGLVLASGAPVIGTSAFAGISLVCNGSAEGFQGGVPPTG